MVRRQKNGGDHCFTENLKKDDPQAGLGCGAFSGTWVSGPCIRREERRARTHAATGKAAGPALDSSRVAGLASRRWTGHARANLEIGLPHKLANLERRMIQRRYPRSSATPALLT